MKYKLIKLKNNKSVLIDKSAEIKENTYYENNGVVFLSDEIYDKGNNPNNSNPKVTDFNNKVVATINHSISLNVPMIIVNDEVEKIALNMIIDISKKQFLSLDTLANIGEGIILGYKAAQQKSYSEEDIINAFNEGQALNVRGKLIQGKDYIQSLKQEYIELEIEASYLDWKKGDKEKLSDTLQLKTTRVDGQLVAYLKQ